MLSRPVPQDRRGQLLLDRPVCAHAFRKLLNLGSNRFTRLKAAAVAGTRAPLDKRSVPQEAAFDIRNLAHLQKRELIVDYLEELWQTVSEPMPEASQKIKRKTVSAATDKKGAKRQKKPNAERVATEVTEDVPRSMQFRRHRGRRPKMAARWHRGADNSEMRVLPPGSFSDYLAVLRAREPHLQISLKLFSKVACLIMVLSSFLKRCQQQFLFEFNLNIAMILIESS